MQLTDVGPVITQFAAASASQSVTPLSDRALRVCRIDVDKPSAADTWNITVGGRTIGTYRIDTVGNQQLLGGPGSAVPKLRSLFDWVPRVLGYPLYYPCPNGQTLTIASAGGATADITISYKEFTPADIQPTELNHYQGSHFLNPIYLAPSTTYAGTSGVTRKDFATQYSLPEIPQYNGLLISPPGYRITVPAIFIEGAGRNTYSGSADHQSVTDHVYLIYKAINYFTRSSPPAGIADIGPASATGSANTVYGSDQTPYPAFQLVTQPEASLLPAPLVFRPGDTVEWGLGVSGDETGNADYSHALLVLLADIQIGVTS